MMRRRELLFGAAAAIALGPRLVFAGDCERDCAEGVARVAAAFRRAQRAGRPLLVLVIPKDDARKYATGVAWGELLNHGTDAQLAPLGAAEVICATAADLRRIVPAQGETEPMAFVVLPGSRVNAQAIEVALPSGHKEEDADRRVVLLGAAVGKAIATDPKRARALAAAARANLVRKPPAGARWATSAGCGVEVEGAPDDGMVVGCGMGHVPQKSRRFLYLLTRLPHEQARKDLEERK